MELHHLRYFIKVAETLHFTKAADALFVTQPALSQQIKQLEDELGTPLFYRIGKKIQLTQAGDTFLPYARKTIETVEQGENAISDLQNLVKGNIRIGVMYTYFAPLLNFLPTFCKEYPDVSLSIYYGNNNKIKSKLNDSQLDIALTFGSDSNEEFDILGRFKANLRIVVSKNHPLATKKILSITQLKNELLILPSEENIIRTSLNQVFKALDMQPFVNTEINDVHLLLDLVERGQYVGIMTDTGTSTRNSIVQIPIKEPINPVDGIIMVKKGALVNKATQLLLDKILDIFKVTYPQSEI